MGPLGFYGSFMLARLVSLHKKSDVATAPTIYGASMLAVTFSVLPLPQNRHVASINGCGCAIPVSTQSDQCGRYNGALI